MLKKKFRNGISVLLVAALVVTGLFLWQPEDVAAKTLESPSAENVFVYVQAGGKNVLLRVLPLAELETLAHGNPLDGDRDYGYSATDNAPAAVYTQARGMTLPELVAHVRTTSGVSGAGGLTFAGGDSVKFMATDSGGGGYDKTWSYETLYGKQGYFYPGLFRSSGGWTSTWEITGSGYSPQGADAMPLSTYMANHAGSDPTYGAKVAVSAGAITVPPILAVLSESDRIDNLAGAPHYVNRNNIRDSLAGKLTTDSALTLCLPQTPDVMFSGNRTMYHYLKWIYNILLVPGGNPGIAAAGEVAAPTANFTRSGNRLTMDLSCPTTGATIYYALEPSMGSAPLRKYDGTPISLDIAAGRDLGASPVRLYMTAVREGYADGGIARATYPESTPPFNPLSSGTLGRDVVFTAVSSVGDVRWADWWDNVSGVDMQPPGGFYAPLVAGSGYLVGGTSGGAAKALTIPAGVFGDVTGTYNIRIRSGNYADRKLSITMRKAAPAVTPHAAYMNGPMDFTFADARYADALSVSIKKEGVGGFQTIPSLYLTGAAGRLTISAAYYSYNNCVIKEPGRYILSFDNASYTPTSQELSIDIQPQSETPDPDPDTPATEKKVVSKLHSPVTTIYLKKGGSLTLPAVAYDKEGKALSVSLKYSSSKTGVATVNSKGKITAKKAGTTKITVKSQNGVKKIVTVKVVKKAKKISRIAINTTSAPAKMKVGKVYYLTFQTTPRDATYGKITFQSNNKNILTIDKAGKITAKKKGKATITVKVGGATVKRGVTIQ